MKLALLGCTLAATAAAQGTWYLHNYPPDSVVSADLKQSLCPAQPHLLQFQDASDAADRASLAPLLVRLELDEFGLNSDQLATIISGFSQLPADGPLMMSADAMRTSCDADDGSRAKVEDLASEFASAFPYAAHMFNTDVDMEFMQQMVDIARDAQSISSDVSVLNVDSLASYKLSANGAESNAYPTALLVYQDALLKLASSTRPVAILAAPQVAKLQQLEKRASPVLGATAVFGVNFTLPFCIADQGTCTNSTQSCFGRGKCIQTRGVCWKCQCNAGFTGDACQLNDYVADFHIVLWTTVVLLTTVIVVVYSMLQMGASTDPAPK